MNRLSKFCDKWANWFHLEEYPTEEEILLFHMERKEQQLAYIEVVEYLIDNYIVINGTVHKVNPRR